MYAWNTTQKMTSSKILLVDTVLWRVVFLGWMNKHIQIKIHEHIEEQQNVSKADLASLPIIFYSYWFERKYFYVFYGKVSIYGNIWGRHFLWCKCLDGAKK